MIYKPKNQFCAFCPWAVFFCEPPFLINVAPTPEQISLSLQQMEAIAENHSRTQCRDQRIMKIISPTDNLHHSSRIYGWGNIVEEATDWKWVKIPRSLLWQSNNDNINWHINVEGWDFPGYTPRQSNYRRLTAKRRISFSRDEPPYESSNVVLSALIPYIQTTKTSTLYFPVCHIHIYMCVWIIIKDYQLEGECGKGWRKKKKGKGGKVIIIF